MYLRRSFPGIFLQNILPSILLTIVVFSTNSFFEQRFDAAVTVNVTCLLSISAFFIAEFEHLPQTTKIKIIDWLLIKCISLSCTTILLQTYYMRRQNGKMMRRFLKMMLIYFIPFIEIAFDLIFILVGILYDYNKH